MRGSYGRAVDEVAKFFSFVASKQVSLGAAMKLFRRLGIGNGNGSGKNKIDSEIFLYKK